MSWCGGGEISPTPGRRVADRADVLVDLVPGQLAALAGLGALSHLDLQLVGVDEVVDRHAEAPGGDLLDRRAAGRRCSGVKRDGSSPPSPVFDLPPSRFIAIARFSCASRESEPRLIAPVQKRLTISLAGSTSSSGIGVGASPPAAPISSRPRSVALRAASSLIAAAYSRYLLERVAAANRLQRLAVALERRRHVPVGRTHGVLEERDRVRVPHVVLAVAPPGVDAADRQQVARAAPGRRARGARAPRARARRGRCRRSRDAVPVKWRSTSSGSSPTASKICAPQ